MMRSAAVALVLGALAMQQLATATAAAAPTTAAAPLVAIAYKGWSSDNSSSGSEHN